MKILLFGIMPLFLALSFPISSVIAQTDNEASEQEKQREPRIETYKENQGIDRLSFTEERKVIGLCKAAQSKLASLESSAVKAQDKHQAVYEDVFSKLDTLVERLSLASVDTSALSSVLSESQSDQAELTVLMANYTQALSDLALMDCESDPVGFKAALQSARVYRSGIVSSVKSLKKTLKETVKPIIIEIRTTLSQGEAGGE